MISPIGGYRPAADLPADAPLAAPPPPTRPPRAEERRDRDETPTETHRQEAPSSSPNTLHRGLVRLRHADLAARYSREQLRRMNRAAFGLGANTALQEHVSEVLAELAGRRAPSTDTRQDGDESFRRYVVLREALERVEADPASAALRPKIEEAIDALLARHGNRIAGDLNITEVLEKYEGAIGSLDRLRSLYHDAVCTHHSIAQTYDALLSAFGPERLRDALKALREAITEDMDSPFASADPKHLARLHADLTNIGTINSLDRTAQAGLLATFPSLESIKVRAEFIGKLLHLVINGGNWAQAKQISDWLAQAAGGEKEQDGGTPAAPMSAAAVRAAALRPERREQALRRFLREDVPAVMWKPNTRNAVTELPVNGRR